MEMKEKTDGNWCLALEMEKDEGEQVVVFPGLIHVKDGLAPPGEGSESPLQLDAQTRSRPKISMQVLIILHCHNFNQPQALLQAWNLFSCDHFFLTGPITGCLLPWSFHSNTTHWSFE